MIKALKGNAHKSLALLRHMDEMRYMFSMMATMMGYDPKLADILTDDNRKHINLAKNSIYFCSDPDPLEPQDEINAWLTPFFRARRVGVLTTYEA